MAKATQLTNASIQELSIVLKHDENGVEFAPRNTEARMLSVKGAEKGLASKALDVLKSYFLGDQDELQTPAEYPVTEAADNIDGDGDGPADYNEIVRAICSLYGDIGSACALTDDGARSAAIVSCIDTFLLGLDALRCCDDDEAGKAGARHSATDLKTLQDAYAAITEIAKQKDVLMGHMESLGVTGAESSDDGDTGKELNDGPNDSGDKAAIVEIVVSGTEVPTVLGKAEEIVIIPEPKEGFEEADKAQSQELDMTKEELDATIAAAVAKATEAAVAAVSASQADSVAKAKTESEAAVAKAQADADAANERARLANETLKAAAGLAAQPTAGSYEPAKKSMSKLEATLRAQMVLNPESHVI